MDFEIVSEITVVETIAAGHGIRDLKRLRRNYGKGRWRKVKGIARIRLGGLFRKHQIAPLVAAVWV